MTAIEALIPTPALAPWTETRDDSTSSNVTACGGKTFVKDTPEKLGPLASVCRMFLRLVIDAGSPSDAPKPTRDGFDGEFNWAVPAKEVRMRCVAARGPTSAR